MGVWTFLKALGKAVVWIAKQGAVMAKWAAAHAVAAAVIAVTTYVGGSWIKEQDWAGAYALGSLLQWGAGALASGILWGPLLGPLKEAYEAAEKAYDLLEVGVMDAAHLVGYIPNLITSWLYPPGYKRGMAKLGMVRG